MPLHFTIAGSGVSIAVSKDRAADDALRTQFETNFFGAAAVTRPLPLLDAGPPLAAFARSE